MTAVIAYDDLTRCSDFLPQSRDVHAMLRGIHKNESVCWSEVFCFRLFVFMQKELALKMLNEISSLRI